MKKVLCLNKISSVGLKTLPHNYEVTVELNEADAILVRSAVMHEMILPENVVAVARAGAGVNNIPLDAYAKAGVVVFNTPGANANAVKEITIAGMLLAARDIHSGMKWVEANKEDVEINKNMEKAKAAFAGTEILGKTIGIFGLGAVGILVAQGADGMGMNVAAYEPSQGTIEKNKDLFPTNLRLVANPDELYAVADYISLNVPLLPATKGMINRESISKMKDGVVIVNAARDAIVNDDDIREALKSGKVRRYVTDFPNHATANMEGVVAIPHLGASTEEAEDNCATMAVKQIVDFIENGNIVNSVNYPNIELGPKTEAHRIVILHEANEGLSGQIIKAIETRGVVKQIVSKVKGVYGVTLLDFVKTIGECSDGVCLGESLAEITGIISLRVIH
ncbi:MAG: 3-phosphoglycerate dehydrogenase [Bacilli bacterium]|jgi:D-3-phosphoglycerate dehydrogenase|nr:3-phosphoglycerate dehydrogenase [Bacilli bacterium]